MGTELIQFDRARLALAEAVNIDEVKLIRDQAEALRQYIRQQGQGLEMQNQCAEIKIRAERRAGEMLAEQISHEGGRPEKPSHDVIVSTPTLSKLGITPMQSQRWQLEASIPEEIFEQYVAETKTDKKELTSHDTLRIALKLKHEEQSQPTNEPVMPDGLFDVIVIDPPWPYGRTYDPFTSRVAPTYSKEMNIEDLKVLNIPSSSDCILWLWATNAFIHEAYHLLEAWGFEPKTILTWFKEQTGVGYWLRGQTEHCILATKGQPEITHVAQGTALIVKATNHSTKPDEFYQLVESLCPGRKLDIFGRKQRKGWEVYGDQLQGYSL